MGERQQDLVAPRLQLERNSARRSPTESELARRIELGDLALHPMLFAETFRRRARLVHQLVVSPSELEWRSAPHLNSPRGKPLPPQLAPRQIIPHALDRTGQQPV